jgi:hypothetical protein
MWLYLCLRLQVALFAFDKGKYSTYFANLRNLKIKDG